MTKKEHRELVFNKYSGKCAYCGIELTKGWHIDEIEPVRRIKKYVPAHWRDKITKEVVKKDTETFVETHEYIAGRYVNDGYLHPERLNIDNQMPACASCNINKHSGSLEEFRQLIQGFMKHLNEVNTQYKIAKRYGLVQENIKPIKFYFETINHENTN